MQNYQVLCTPITSQMGVISGAGIVLQNGVDRVASIGSHVLGKTGNIVTDLGQGLGLLLQNLPTTLFNVIKILDKVLDAL